ncbi:unnamed protein product [Nippostrongylus brasiliensis]|uniref:Leishmanolysin-like peptidase n=1 Tax=Nippostrongylus brasiliensis TaxID=27835 RepID=A0A158R064_NIPBR|nr:unnamed protein product [Nippostrongylus brasiliensis]
MLLLSPDSGFNSPCGDFAASSSLQSPFYVRKSFQYYSSRRKLEFDSASSSIDKTLGGSCDENASEFKAREIARRLVHLCDSFDVELMSCTIDTQYLHPQPEPVAIFGPPEEGENNHNHTRVKRSETWEPIRIMIIYDKSTESLVSRQKVLLHRLMSSARDYFQETFKVKRSEYIELQPECEGFTYVTPPDYTMCQYDCLPRCGPWKVRPGMRIFKACKCYQRKCRSTWTPYRGRLKGADFVVFVTLSSGGLCGNSGSAYASACSLDPITKRSRKFQELSDSTPAERGFFRPISGYVNICPITFGKFKSNEMAQWLATIKHELTHNEAMSAVATQVYAMSRITLALFEDSGWYEANYSKAEDMTWGKGLGCEFAKESCLSWMTGGHGYYPFCVEKGHIRCNANHKAKVLCNFVQYHQIPYNYDYNVPGLYHNKQGQELHGGGNEETADFCPYYRVFGDMWKEDRDTRCTYKGNMNYNSYSMEIFSETARCFELEGGIEAICLDDLVQVKWQGSEYYNCSHAGELIHVKKKVRGKGVASTKIICPNYNAMCGESAPKARTIIYVYCAIITILILIQ